MTALDRSAVEMALRSAEEAHGEAVRKLGAAREQLAHAEAKLDEAQTEAARKAVSFAKIDLESTERVEKKRSKELDGARSTMRKLVREEQTEAFTSAKAKLAELPGLLGQHGERLVALDQQIGDEVLAAVRDVATAIKAYDDAQALAAELGEAVRFAHDFARPTVADARLACARYVTVQRLAATPPRPAVAPQWLADASHDLRWERVAADATELAARDAAARQAEDLAARQGRAQREAHLVNTTAALVAAANVTPTNVPPNGAAT